MIRLLIAPGSLFTTSSAMAQPEGVPPGPPTVEVVGTVDANVVNTVGTKAVTEYRVVGASEATITGDANGIRGLHDLCQAEFGIEARICTTPEVVATTDLTALEFGKGISAWVQPVIASHGLVHNPDANQISERLVGFCGRRDRRIPRRYLYNPRERNLSHNIELLALVKRRRELIRYCLHVRGRYD